MMILLIREGHIRNLECIVYFVFFDHFCSVLDEGRACMHTSTHAGAHSVMFTDLFVMYAEDNPFNWTFGPKES